MLDLSRTKKYPFGELLRKVDRKDFAGTPTKDCDMAGFLSSLPNFLGVKELRGLSRAIVNSCKRNAPVNFAMGAHVIKAGCSPIIIDLIKRDIITGILVNGAFAIHDVEVGMFGKTSENVDENLPQGKFGFSREAADIIEAAAIRAVDNQHGFGRTIVRYNNFPYESILQAAYDQGIPVGIMAAMGTDTIHMLSNNMGKVGEASHLDFRIMAEEVTKMENGTWVNIGSAVILPECFLKMVSIARNLGYSLDNLITANLDMNEAYRTIQNVLKRPAKQSFSITGQHELLLPLLRMQILKDMK